MLLDNIIGPEGATALANALATNTSIHSVDLACNYLILFETHILSANNIGRKGATALANTLATNTSIQTLNLMGKYLYSVGGSLIVR